MKILDEVESEIHYGRNKRKEFGDAILVEVKSDDSGGSRIFQYWDQ